LKLGLEGNEVEIKVLGFPVPKEPGLIEADSVRGWRCSLSSTPSRFQKNRAPLKRATVFYFAHAFLPFASRFQKNRAPLKQAAREFARDFDTRVFPVPKEPGPIEAPVPSGCWKAMRFFGFPVPKEPGPIEAGSGKGIWFKQQSRLPGSKRTGPH